MIILTLLSEARSPGPLLDPPSGTCAYPSGRTLLGRDVTLRAHAPTANVAWTGRLDLLRRSRWLLGLAVLVLLFFSFSPESGRAQPVPDAHARVSVDSARIGEPFTLTLRVRRPGEATSQFPDADAETPVFGDLDVLKRGPKRTKQGGATRSVDSVTYEVTTFALDTAYVPTLPVRVLTDADTTIMSTSPAVIRVPSVLDGGPTRLREGDVLLPFPRPLWTWFVLVGAGMAILGGAGYLWWWNRPNANGVVEGLGDDRPARVVAKEQLRQLRAYDLTDPQAVEAFYVEMANTVRTHLSVRLGVVTRERTTHEVVARLHRRTEMTSSACDRVKGILEQADLVKFAGVRPDPSSAVKALKEAREAVDAIESAASPEAATIQKKT